ncbi:MAG: hypothetical protein AB7Q00_05340 [Phycisphaerales bacterium]
MKTRATLALFLSLAAFIAPCVIAQPGPDAPPAESRPRRGPGQNPGPEAFGDRDAIAARLERRLHEIDRERERLAGAIERLHTGEDPAGVMGEMNEGRGNGRPGEDKPRSFPPRGSDHPEGPNAGSGALPEISPEQTLEFIRVEAPQAAVFLDRLKEQSPSLHDRWVSRLTPRVREFMTLKATDAELYEVKRREWKAGWSVFAAAREVREAVTAESPDENAKVSAVMKLRSALAEHMDARLEGQRREIRDLENRITQLRDRMERAEQERPARIDEVVAKITDPEFRPERLLMPLFRADPEQGESGEKPDGPPRRWRDRGESGRTGPGRDGQDHKPE